MNNKNKNLIKIFLLVLVAAIASWAFNIESDFLFFNYQILLPFTAAVILLALALIKRNQETKNLIVIIDIAVVLSLCATIFFASLELFPFIYILINDDMTMFERIFLGLPQELGEVLYFLPHLIVVGALGWILKIDKELRGMG